MAPAATDLAVLADAKSYCGVTTTADDVLLQALITGASVAITRYLQRDLLQLVYGSGGTAPAEIRSGNDADRMTLRQWPVTTITQVVVSNLIIPQQPAISPQQIALTGTYYGWGTYVAPGWVLEPPRTLWLAGYRFWRGPANVSISYTAGYVTPGQNAITPALAVTLPQDLTMACWRLVGYRYREKSRIADKSKSIGGEVIAYDLVDFPLDVLGILNRHRNVVPA